jgi:GTP-binding protein
LNKPSVCFVSSAASAAQFPCDGLPEVAFLGRSNVGKSRLLNALAGTRGLARVSSQPGRTQLVNFFLVDKTFYFVDLPGYGYAKIPEAVRRGFKDLVNAYLERDSLALAVFLVDVRHPPTADDEMLQHWLDERGLPYLVAATKVDKLGHGALQQRLRELQAGVAQNAIALIGTSAEDGTGVPDLLGAVRRAAQAHGGAHGAAGREA